MIHRVFTAVFKLIFPSGAGIMLLLLAGGCATQPDAPKNIIFYPPPPDQPRFQYLTGFSSGKEFFGESEVRKFVLGRASKDKFVGKPYGIAASQGRIFYCDSGISGVGLLKLDKQAMEYFTPDRDGQMKTPMNTASDAAGNLYVTDTEREQVLIYDKNGVALEPMGKKDEMKPCGITIAGENLYVTDLKSRQVRIYRLSDRTLVRTIPRADDAGKGKLYQPVNVAVDKQGKVYVSDPGNFCVQIYDAEGRHLRSLGQQGVGPGKFARPKGIAVDHEGRVYVVDAAAQRVQLFDGEGRLLIYLGNPNLKGPGSTCLPAGVAVDYENAPYFEKFCAPGKKLEYVVYLTDQYGSPKISVYGFLKQP